MQRRSILLAGLALTPVSAAFAAVSPGGMKRLRVGADSALIASGLAGALQRAFERDTGIPVEGVGGPALPLLDALVAGELDAALLNAGEPELARQREGLVHDRQPIALGDFVLVGRRLGGRGRRGGAGNAASALARWAQAAQTAPAAVFLSANDGSGTHLAEQALWRAAGIAPQAPWYRAAREPARLIGEARRLGAHAVVERGAWSAHGGGPLAILAGGDAALLERVHAMRSFRSPHPAGKLFVGWIAGARGRAVVVRQQGYRAPAG